MAEKVTKNETAGLSWDQQLHLDDQRERMGEYPYIIPAHVESKNQEALKLMENLKQYISKSHGEATMIAWFKPCKARGLQDGRFAIWTPYKHSSFWSSYIQQNFSYALESFRKFHKLEEVILFPYIPNAMSK